MKVCGQIFKQSSCCHTVKAPEQNLTSLRGFGLSKISPNLCSSGVELCGHPELTGHQQNPFPAKMEQLAPQIAPALGAEGWLGTPGLLFVGRGSWELPMWEFLLLGLATPANPCMENPIKEQPDCQLWQHQGWELHLSDAESRPVFSPCTQKLGERSHTCSFSQGWFSAVLMAFGLAPQAPPWATSPHNSGLGCAI